MGYVKGVCRFAGFVASLFFLDALDYLEDKARILPTF